MCGGGGGHRFAHLQVGFNIVVAVAVVVLDGMTKDKTEDILKFKKIYIYDIYKKCNALYVIQTFCFLAHI